MVFNGAVGALMGDKVRQLFAMADPKYLPMMLLPLVVPYVALGPVNGWIVLGGIVAVAALNLLAVLVNTYSDRAGDQLNIPDGYAAVDRTIGYDRLDGANDVAKVSVIGIGMRSHAGVAAKAFRALAERQINIRAISTSEIKFSLLIDAEEAELAVRRLHSLYGLDK